MKRPGEQGFRPDIEGLLGIVVLLVVLYHADLPGLGGGFTGVDVFFVLSGYLITGLLVSWSRSPWACWPSLPSSRPARPLL